MAALASLWAEAWLPAFILAAGLTLGALVTLALGHLMRESWLEPLHPALAAIARAAPILLPLGLPLLLAGPVLYPWFAAPVPDGQAWYRADTFMLRSLGVLLVWIWLGRRLTGAPVSRRMAGVAMVLLVLTGAFAMEDWALSRDRGWTGSLQGLALVVEQTGAALAVAALLALRHGLPGEAARTGLERALLAFGLLTLWLWFVQYIVVYAADLPHEAAWYLRRSDGVWGWIKVGVALPALLGAIALALVPQWRRWRLAAVCVLLLVEHLAHLGWIIRPDAVLSGGATPPLADALVGGLMVVAVVVAWRRAARTA